MRFQSALLTVALFAPLAVKASGITFKSNVACQPEINRGCSADKAPSNVRSQCGHQGDFFYPYGNSALCCSSTTVTTPPSSLTCPLNYGYHKDEKCCVPKTEVCSSDCGEGYTYNSAENKCVANTGSCSQNEWWHERSSSCCPHTPPTPGTCSSGCTCPTDWYWCTSTKTCRPNHNRSPQPDCSNWNDQTQCCGGTQPSHRSGSGSGGYNNGGGYNEKRDAIPEPAPAPAPAPAPVAMKKRLPAAEEQIPLTATELNAMYCPKALTACTVFTPSSSNLEWAYECVDTKTELTSCGGCSSTGEGQDCTAIAGGKSVGCKAGLCEVYSCLIGYTAVNGTSCVKN